MQHNEPSAVERSLAMYRRLLRAYPPAFREQYGDEMARVFRDAARAAWRQSGLAGMTVLWARTLTDTLINATRERVCGPRKGLTATRWEVFASKARGWAVEVLPDLPWIVVCIVLYLNERWLPTLLPPDRGWAVLFETVMAGLIARVVMKRIDAPTRWSNSINAAGLIAWWLWATTSKELGLVGPWERALPWVVIVCSAAVNSIRWSPSSEQSEGTEWVGWGCVAVSPVLLLLVAPAPYLATNVFLLFVVVVNGLAAVLPQVVLKAREGDANAE